MPNLTCPMPTNINPLSSNGFNFSITKIPDVTFFCQEVNLPSMTLPSIDIATPLSYDPVAGDMILFDDLNIQFIIDENMTNYQAIFNWITGLGFPANHLQYRQFIDIQNLNRMMSEYSDATLQILGSNNQPVKTVKFVDIIPTSLNTLTFQSTSNDVQYLVGNATFKINRYEFI